MPKRCAARKMQVNQPIEKASKRNFETKVRSAKEPWRELRKLTIRMPWRTSATWALRRTSWERTPTSWEGYINSTSVWCPGAWPCLMSARTVAAYPWKTTCGGCLLDMTNSTTERRSIVAGGLQRERRPIRERQTGYWCFNSIATPMKRRCSGGTQRRKGCVTIWSTLWSFWWISRMVATARFKALQGLRERSRRGIMDELRVLHWSSQPQCGGTWVAFAAVSDRSTWRSTKTPQFSEFFLSAVIQEQMSGGANVASWRGRYAASLHRHEAHWAWVMGTAASLMMTGTPSVKPIKKESKGEELGSSVLSLQSVEPGDWSQRAEWEVKRWKACGEWKRRGTGMRNFTIQHAKADILGRSKTLPELWEEHLGDPLAFGFTVCRCPLLSSQWLAVSAGVKCLQNMWEGHHWEEVWPSLDPRDVVALRATSSVRIFSVMYGSRGRGLLLLPHFLYGRQQLHSLRLHLHILEMIQMRLLLHLHLRVTETMTKQQSIV